MEDRTMRRAKVLSAVFGVFWIVAGAAVAQEEQEFTDDFPVDDCEFSDTGRNAYFSLEPGDRLVLEGDDDGETVVVQITVLKDRRWINFETDEGEPLWIRTRVIEEREWLDGELIEVSRNFFARCEETNDVYYFGEDVDIYEDGEIVSHDGAWRAGVDGALPGLIMPGTALLGSRYFQEIAPDVALDRAEHVALGFEMEVPAGTFDDCLEVVETTPLEPGHESTKIYCEGVGLVVDSDAELVETNIDDEDEDEDDGGDGGWQRGSRTKLFGR
jgi:hypothetical protein